MKEFISASPLKVLEKTSSKELGKGNLGVLIARAGVGKTACLIHIALDKLFRQEKLVHVSLEETPDKIISYYNVMYADLVSALHISDDQAFRARIDRDRMILAYLNKSFDVERLRASLRNLSNELGFRPSTLIVDGLNFEKAERAMFEGFKDIALDSEVEIWFSALSHRHIKTTNERGIPYPCDQLEDLFSIIMHLKADPSGIFLSLLKDHNNPTLKDTHVSLDPETSCSLE